MFDLCVGLKADLQGGLWMSERRGRGRFVELRR